MPSTSTGPGGLEKIVIDHPAATGEFFLQGAHLTAWQPRGQKPVLFMSPLSKYAPGVALRGGVPVCLPWFGPKAGAPAAPAHGFARTRDWQLVDQQKTADAAVVTLRFAHPGDSAWPQAFSADLVFTLGASLEMRLTVRNDSPRPMTFEAALHTYYAVGDARAVTVAGLSGTQYLDKPDNQKRKTETSPAIAFTAETDRVYQNTDATCTINDPGLGRQIVVAKTGSKSTVVWNPFPERAGQLKDLGEANWPGFVCVETANVGENAVTLPAGESHTMTVHVTLLPHDLPKQSGT